MNPPAAPCLFEANDVDAVVLEHVAHRRGYIRPGIEHSWVELPGGIVFDGTCRGYFDRTAYYLVTDARLDLQLTREELAKKMLSAGMWAWYAE